MQAPIEILTLSGRTAWVEGAEGGSSAAGAAPAVRREVDPAPGKLVIFRARTVIHEVLPTNRKRFAVTLWFYGAPPADNQLQLQG